MPDSIINLLYIHKATLFLVGSKLLNAVVIIVAGIIINNIFKKLITHVRENALQIDDTLLTLARVVLKYALIIVCLIMILGVFGINAAGLIALLGTVGVAIGLALKDTLGNIAAGVVLLLLKSYRKGDFIEFNGFMGTIKDFDLFTTKLETPDGVLISAPNSCIWQSPLKNYSRNTKRRMDLVIGISYRDSIDTAYRVMREIVDTEPRFLPDPAPQIVVQSLSDSSVNILLRAWAPSNVYWDVYWKHMRLIKEKIEEAGLSIPFPQRDVHLIT
jgi:small conductance mechanosensitive channel